MDVEPSPSTDILPRCGSVRTEDGFDVAAAHHWLRQYLDVGEDPPVVQQFRGGASNLTYVLRYSERDLVLRRPPNGHIAASAHDMSREYDVQRRVAPVFPYVPDVLALCEDSSVIGSPFYVMTYVPGPVPDSSSDADPAGLVRAAHRHIEIFADLHTLDVAELGLAALSRGPGYVARQVSGWSRRYRNARTSNLPDAEGLMAWLDAHAPPDGPHALVHGDWRLDNMVLDPQQPGRIRAVLDWEMATVGDPLMDLGASLAYWVQSDDEPAFRSLARQPSTLPGMPTRSEYVDRYLRRRELHDIDMTYYEVFGHFRLAVILAQIWLRFVNRQSSNPTFASFGAATALLIERADQRR